VVLRKAGRDAEAGINPLTRFLEVARPLEVSIASPPPLAAGAMSTAAQETRLYARVRHNPLPQSVRMPSGHVALAIGCRRIRVRGRRDRHCQDAAVVGMRQQWGWPFISAEPPQFVVLSRRAVGYLARPLGHYPDHQLEARLMFDGRMEPSERRGIRPRDPYAELLGQLVDEGIARGFAELDMTPRQVPDAGVRDASRAPMPQQHPLMLNQSPGHHVIHAAKLITATGAGG
jgi:hypothetical protein